jgi:hypothetical protein
MLHDLDKTLERIIIADGNLRPNEVDIAFEQPSRDWSSRLSRPTVNCWCFDLRETRNCAIWDGNQEWESRTH